MTFGRDSYGIEKECLVCESPTKSHPAPNGYLCHSCLTDKDESELLDALPLGPLPELDMDTSVQCRWCDHEHTLREASGADPSGVIRVGIEFPVFETYTALALVSCPSCTKTTERLTTEEQAKEFADTHGVDLMTYDRRKGWDL